MYLIEHGPGEEEEETNLTDSGGDDDGEQDDNPDGEGDDRGDEATETEEEEEAPAVTGKREAQIPRARFDEVNNKATQLAEENARLRGQIEGRDAATRKTTAKEDDAPGFDYDAQEAAYAEALMEGDAKKAAGIRKEINTHLRSDAKTEAVAESTVAFQRQSAADKLTEMGEAVVETYPFLDGKGATANKQAIADVVDMRDVFIARGDAPHIALKKAAEKIGPLYAKKPKAQAAAAEEADEGEDDEAAPAPDSLAERRKARQKAMLTRNATAARQQAPVLTGASNRVTAGAADIAKMSEGDYRKLPEQEKRKLRGDAL